MSEYVPFTHRYGLANFEDAARWDGAGWRSRHSINNGREPADEFLRCICPGGGGIPNSLTHCACTDRASQEDRLCDHCRVNCYAVDDNGGHHSFVTLHGAAR